MWHWGLNLVQSCRMWCAVCTLPHSHKSEAHRPISFMLAANRPTLVLRRLSWTQTSLGRLKPGGCRPNAGMKDLRAGGISVVCSLLLDNNWTKEWRGFLEWRRLEGCRYRVLCRRCFGLRVLMSSFKHEALWLVSVGLMPHRMGKEVGVLHSWSVIMRIDSFIDTSVCFVWMLGHSTLLEKIQEPSKRFLELWRKFPNRHWPVAWWVPL